MRFVDKLKDIFFEEEEDEEEVEDTRPPKKEKEVIAKRIELPKRKKEVEFVEEKEFEEIPATKETSVQVEEPKKEIPKKELPKRENKITELIFDDEDFILDVPKEEPKSSSIASTYTPTKEFREERELFSKEEIRERKENPPYEYTSGKEAEAKKTFTPSPIISPIYGILDKNYRKEEVKERKEIRLSRPGRVDLDTVRNKAFGDLEGELLPRSSEEDEEEVTFKDEAPKRDIKKIREKSGNEKPVIDKVTLGEADEYYNDLGLAYNADYKDISKEINDGKIRTEEDDDTLEDNLFDLIDAMHDKEE